MLRWLGSLPDFALFALFGAFGIALTWVFDKVMRRRVSAETRERTNATASVTLQVTATIYAILIAFVIVDAYEQIRATQAQISEKAANLSIVAENTRAFPEPAGDAIRAASLRYAEAFLSTGLPRLERSGDASPRTSRRFEALLSTVQRVNTSTDAQRAAYASMVNALDAIVRTREGLINSARATVSGTLLALLVVIGATVMAVATALDTGHRQSHLFILSALALVIWLTLALVVSMTNPFAGPMAVTDAPVREFVEARAAR